MNTSPPTVRFSSIDNIILSPILKPFLSFRLTIYLSASFILILTFLSISGRAQENADAPSPTPVSADASVPTSVPNVVDSAPKIVREHLSDTWFDALVSEPRPKQGKFPPSAAHSRLLALSWLVGCWELKANDLVFQTKVDWAPGGAYLVCRDFVRPFAPVGMLSVRTKSGEKSNSATTPRETSAFAALRIIGWNPISELFQTTIFCRDGSSGNAVWQANDDVWIVSTRILLADGRAATSIDFIRPQSPGGFVWESRSRTIENTSLPNLGPAEARAISSRFFREIEPNLFPEPAGAATAE